MPFAGGIGIPELIIVLVIVLVIFGPKRLPAMGRSLGSSMREFKDSITSKHDDDDEERTELTAAEASPDEATPDERAPAEASPDEPRPEPARAEHSAS